MSQEEPPPKQLYPNSTFPEPDPEPVLGVPVADDTYVPAGIPFEPEGDPEPLPEPGEREGVAGDLFTSVEPNIVASALVLVVAVLCDGLTSLDPSLGAAEAPCSLRTSSIVALLALAAPAIGKFSLVDQRMALSVLLVVLALAGLHYATEAGRIGDAVYTGFVLTVAVQVYASGGVEAKDIRPDAITASPHRRQTVSGLCGALMLYAATRGVRAAFTAAEEVRKHRLEYRVAGEVRSTLAHAEASTSTVVPLALGHGTLVATALLIATNEGAHVTGSSAVAFEVGAAGIAATVAAFWGFLGRAESIDALPVLYGPSACIGKRELCEEAYRSRRFAESVHASAGLWVAALGAMVFAFAIEQRVPETTLTRAERLFERQGFGSGLFLLLAALMGVVVYGSTDGAEWYVDGAMIGCLFGIFVTCFAASELGSAIYAGCFIWFLSSELETNQWSRMINTFAGSAVLLQSSVFLVRLAIELLKLPLSVWFEWHEWSVFNQVPAALATIGTSASFVLYIGTAIEMATTNGAAIELRDQSGGRTVLGQVLVRFTPLFAWMPLYACRCEIRYLDSRVRAAAWIFALPLLVLVYSVAITVAAIESSSESTIDPPPTIELWSARAVGAVGMLAWLAVAFV